MDRKIGYGLKKFIKTTLIQVFKCYCLKKKITQNLPWLVLPGEICFVSFYFLAT